MRRATSTLVALAALLSLSATASFHTHSARISGAAFAAPGASLLAAKCERGQPPHDADLCPICRASAQARLALRTPARAVSLDLTDASLPLQLRELAAPTRAPALRSGAPRAPPASSALEA